MGKHLKRRKTFVIDLPIGRWIEFPHWGTRVMPRVPALYALYRDKQIVYIGQTVNLRARFITAYRRRTDVTLAKIKLVKDASVLDMAEKRLISRLKPVENHEHTGRHRRHPRRLVRYGEAHS